VKNRTLYIVIGVIVVVLGLAGIAVAVSGGDDSSESATTAPSGDVEETRKVSVSGDVVPTLDAALVDDPAIGTAFPTIEGQTFDGTPITVGGPTDGPTMVVYLAHWCPHCNAEIPELVELNDTGGIPEELTVVGVSTAVDATAPNYPPSSWLADKGWPWKAMADDEASTGFVVSGGSGFPYLVILDADGKIIARDSGEKSAEDLKVWIDDALASTTT
jgi:cytochrome c biogenesis protein CcmG/thiol:disulfide interchange protein DsbE